MLSTRSFEQHGMLEANAMLLLCLPVAVRSGQPPTACMHKNEG